MADIKFFVPGSAGGREPRDPRDRLHLQHLTDLTNASTGDAGHHLQARLTKFINRSRSLHGIAHPVVCGASIRCALNKTNGSIRLQIIHCADCSPIRRHKYGSAFREDGSALSAGSR
jgi:hypothetical protein